MPVRVDESSSMVKGALVLAAKRLRERGAVFVALAGVAFTVSALGAGLSGYLAHAETAGVRTELQSRAGAELALEGSLALAADASAQDAAMRDLLARELPTAGDEPPLIVTRTVTGDQRLADLRAGDRTEGSLLLLSADDLPELATLVTGAWPTSPGEVSVQADAAAALALELGSPVMIGTTETVVTATWRIDDPLAGRWLGDAEITSGRDGDGLGPIVIDESLWAASDATARVRWAITADAATMRPENLRQIIAGWAEVPDAVRADDAIESVTYEDRGRLTATAAQLLERIEALRAIVPVALLTIAAIALLTTVELARLLTSLRAAEYRLLWSRGSTAGALAATAALETAATVVPGAILGVGAAFGVLALALGAGDATPTALAVATPTAVAVGVTLVVAAATLVAANQLEARDSAARSPRSRRVVGFGAVALVTLAAALSTWQLRLYGSPVTTSADGTAGVDPIAVVAPTLVLVSVVLLALAAVPAFSPALNKRIERSRRLAPSFVGRTMTRQTRLTAIPLVLAALAAGQLVVAAGYAATWDTSYSQARELRAGSEISITGRLDETVLDRAAGVAGVTAVAPLISQNTAIGSEQASLVAIAPEALATLAGDGGVLDVPAMAAAVSSGDRGAPPEGGVLELQVDTSQLAAAPDIRALMTDALGGLHTVPLTTTDGSSYSAQPADPEWVLLALDFDLPTDSVTIGDEPTVRITGGTIDLTAEWSAVTLAALNYELEPLASGVGFVPYQGGTVRLVTGPVTEEPPVVVSQLLADQTGVVVGDTLPIVVEPRAPAVVATVAAIAPAIPGARREFAALVDIAALHRLALRLYDSYPVASGAWIGTDPDTIAATSTAVREAMPARVSVMSLSDDQGRAILGSAAVTLWIGAAGALLLAIVALIAVAGAQLRARRGEVVLLRALGVDAATMASMRRLELGIAAAIGILVGVVGGVLVTVLTVPALARAAVPDPFIALATAAQFAALPLVVGIGAIVVAIAVIALVYGAAVGRQSHRLGAREDIS